MGSRPTSKEIYEIFKKEAFREELEKFAKQEAVKLATEKKQGIQSLEYKLRENWFEICIGYHPRLRQHWRDKSDYIFFSLPEVYEAIMYG
jgi:hypothetical protein